MENPHDIQSQLTKRERELASLLANIPDLVSRFDRQFRHLAVNRSVEYATGLGAHEFVGKSNREMGMPEALVSFWEEKIGSVFATGLPCHYEFDFECPDGIHKFEGRLLPEFDEQGQVETALCIVQDVTARRHLEEARRQRDEMILELADHALDIVFRYEIAPKPRYAYISRSIQGLTGFAPTEFYARVETGLFVIHEEDRPQVAAVLRGNIEHPVLLESRFVGRNGTQVWAELRLSPVFDNAGKVTAIEGLIRNISQKKNLEQQLQIAQAELAAARAEIRRLNELSPLCEECQKARDYRMPVGARLTPQSDDKVSSFVCPECLQSRFTPHPPPFFPASKDRG